MKNLMNLWSIQKAHIIIKRITIIYGCKVKDVLREFKERAKKEIDKLTSMNVVSLEVVAKNVYVPEKEDEEN